MWEYMATKRKPGRPKNRSRAGRPPKMTPETVKKLEEAFALGCTDREACFFAGITKPTLYKYQDENPDFIDRKKTLKERPVLLARQSVIEHMEGDGKLALEFLKCKKKNEFSTKAELDIGENLTKSISDTLKLIRERRDAQQHIKSITPVGEVDQPTEKIEYDANGEK